MALSRGGAEGRTAGPLGFGPHLRPLCGPPLQQQHDFWSSPVSVGSTRRVKKKKSEKKGKSIIGIFSRIFASQPRNLRPAAIDRSARLLGPSGSEPLVGVTI